MPPDGLLPSDDGRERRRRPARRARSSSFQADSLLQARPGRTDRCASLTAGLEPRGLAVPAASGDGRHPKGGPGAQPPQVAAPPATVPRAFMRTQSSFAATEPCWAGLAPGRSPSSDSAASADGQGGPRAGGGLVRTFVVA